VEVGRLIAQSNGRAVMLWRSLKRQPMRGDGIEVREVVGAEGFALDDGEADFHLLPVSADAAEGFYRLVDVAYERRSLAVSSNLHPSGFDEIMPKTLATATVDRLLYHAPCVVVTAGRQPPAFRSDQGQRRGLPRPDPCDPIRARPWSLRAHV
jgi:hypothetical protein